MRGVDEVLELGWVWEMRYVGVYAVEIWQRNERVNGMTRLVVSWLDTHHTA